eukprot:6181215-Pleurochrysis_carterae.AAC.1
MEVRIFGDSCSRRCNLGQGRIELQSQVRWPHVDAFGRAIVLLKDDELLFGYSIIIHARIRTPSALFAFGPDALELVWYEITLRYVVTSKGPISGRYDEDTVIVHAK